MYIGNVFETETLYTKNCSNSSRRYDPTDTNSVLYGGLSFSLSIT